MQEQDQESSNEEEVEDSDDENKSHKSEEEEKKGEGEGDENVKIITLQFFKFWSSKGLRSAWRNYVFEEVTDNNVLALSVAVLILERVNGEFL